MPDVVASLFFIAGDKAQNVLWRVNNFHFSSNLNLKYAFILCGTNNIDHNSPQSIASTIISTGLAFQKKSRKIHVVSIPLLPRDHKHSRRRGIINTVNKLLKFQCLNNGFHFLEFKSNWLNNDDSLNIELFYDDDLHLIWKDNELLVKEIINFYYHSKYTVAYSKPSYRNITSFSFNYADFPPLSSKSSTVNSFNSLQSSKLCSNSNFSTQKSFAESVLKSNHTLFPLETTSTQNSCFSPSAHKSTVASAPVKIFSSFSSNSDNSLGSRAFLAICKANSNPKSNLARKDHSKFHFAPVSIKPAKPVSNSCVSSTLSNSSDAIVQKPSFDSYSFKSSSPFKSTTPKSSISVSPTNRNNFSFSVPSVINSNDSKPVCAPPQTSHLSPFPIKSSRQFFHSSTQTCQSNFSQNQKVFHSASLFQVSELPFQCNATATLPFTIIPLRSSAICIFLLNLLFSFILLTCSSCFILNFNILVYILLTVLVFIKFYTNSAGLLFRLMEVIGL